MRIGDYIYKAKGFSFFLEFDSGGDPNYPWTIWVYKDGKPYILNNVQFRREFTKGTEREEMVKFCKEFVKNNQ